MLQLPNAPNVLIVLSVSNLGYKLSSEKLCYLSEPTEPCCAKEKENGECEKCNAGLILADGNCVEKIIPGCL